jgi:outer membrane receptor for ferrienterochelin and colicins
VKIAIKLQQLLRGGGGSLIEAEKIANTQTASKTTPSTSLSNGGITELDEIKVVSAAGYEQNVADAPASIYVITKEELEKKSFNDLTEVLKTVPGVYITGGSAYKDISIRGMSSEYTLFLVDGKPMNSNEAYNLNANQVGLAANFLPPVSLIERIEVIKGPMSSLYGNEALGGVINIITKKVPAEWSGSVKGEYTKSLSDISQDSYQGSVNIAGPIIPDVLSLQTYGSIIKVDEWQCPQDIVNAGTSCGQRASAPSPNFDNRQVGAKVVWSIDEANSAWAAYDYSKQVRTSTSNVSVAGAVGGTGSGHRANTLALKQTVSAGHDLKLDDLIVNTYIQNAVTKNPLISRSSMANGGVGIDYEVLTFNTQANYFFETNVLSVGGQYKKEALDDRATNTMVANAVAKRWSYALFAEDEWSVLDDLALTLGGRFTNDEGFGTHVDPRIYLVYNLTDDFLLKGGVSSAYKSVAIRRFSDDFNSVGTSNTLTKGNPDVKPEMSVNYEVSLAYTNKDTGFGASLTAYHSNFKDRISSETICTAPSVCEYKGVTYDSITSYINIGRAVIQGLEATLNYDISPSASLSATYTYTDSEIKSGGTSGKGGASVKGNPLNNIAKHMFNMNADFDINEKVSVWAQYNYNGKYPEAVNTTTVTNKAYKLVDVGAVIRPKKGMDVILGLYNVFNKEITSATHGRYIDGRRVTLGVNANF